MGAVPDPKKRRRPALDRLHRTVDVPQADRLENVRQLAMALRDGIHNAPALLELLGVDQRHFNYYRRAAEILNLIEAADDDGMSLTDRGRELVATPEGSVEERRVFATAIRAARALRPFTSFFDGEELPLASVAERLATLTGLSQSTAERRARTLLQWRRYVDEVPGSSTTDLQLPNTAEELRRTVARHNALAKQRILEWLQTITPTEFESIVAELVRAMNYEEVEVRGGAGDGGIDVTAVRMDEWGHRASVALQVKRYRRPLGRRFVDELSGSVARQRFTAGVLVTTSDFTSKARSAANESTALQLVNGPQFVDLLAKNSVMVTIDSFGALTLSKSLGDRGESS
jgi:restriction endonuclease Mrr